MRSGGRLIALLAPWGLVACGAPGPWVGHGPIPEGAQTVLFGLEQGERRAVWGHPLETTPLAFELPPEFDASTELGLSRVHYAEPLSSFGLTAAGRLVDAPARAQPLSSYAWLSADYATLGPELELSPFEIAPPPEWLMRHPIARPRRCVRAVREEPISSLQGPRDLLPLDESRAAGLSLTELFLLEDGAPARRFPVPGPGRGQVLGQGVEGWIWVVTTSAAIAFHPATETLGVALPLPPETLPVGFAEDPVTRELYLFSSAARLLRKPPEGESFSPIFEVPPEHVRPNLHKHVAHLHFAGPRRLLVAIEDVGVAIELVGEEGRTLRGERIGSGFPVIASVPGGRSFVVESALGDLFEYLPGRLERRGKAATGLVGLEALDDGAERFLYLGASGALGSVDLVLPGDCPEVSVGALVGAKELVRVGARYLVLGQTSTGYGFSWLDVELSP